MSTTISEAKAFSAGQRAYKRHATRGSNPYSPDRQIGAWRAWDDGWEKADELREEIGNGGDL